MIEIGTAVGRRYAVVRRAGRGGMADVFVAHDERLGREVAIKAFRGTDAADRLRFDAEARVLASLDHPGLVRVLDAGEHEGTPFLVLELVDGPSLADLLRPGRPLDEATTHQITLDLSAALAYVHAQGVVHRDVKPSNILFDANGRARLADFGIARLADASHLTAPATSMGTAAYMAPEQVEGAEVGPAADVYAFGLVLLECLTGTRAFDGPPREAALARLARDPEISADVPAGWGALIRRMTARDPVARPPADGLTLEFPSEADATIRLDAVAETSTMAAPVVAATPTPPSEPTRRTPRRVGVLALLALAGALAAWGLLSLGGPDHDAGPVGAVATSLASTVPPTQRPTTTTSLPTCEAIEEALDLLEEEKKDLGKQFKGDKEGREQAKSALDEQKDDLEQQRDACED